MGKNKDLALLKINPKHQLQTVEFGNSEEAKSDREFWLSETRLAFRELSHQA